MNTIQIYADQKKGVISKHIYGQFSEHLGRCIYEGFWVGEDSPIPNTKGIRNDVVEALKNIKIPNLRWPGGCFADEYHWKDGVGPKSDRKYMINTHWGGVVENNHFGTHEFMLLCELLECEPYICGNVGSGTVQEMSEWVEYMTFDGESPMARWRRENGREKPWKLKYFGVGNENWGCGGNMRAEYYADEYKRYQTYCRNYGDNKLFKIACGPSGGDYHWTEVLMKEAKNMMDGLSLHQYTVEGDVFEDKGYATAFDEKGWFQIMKNSLYMEELVKKHSAVMDVYDPQKKVALVVDEWGTWHEVEPGSNPGFLYQQNTLRDALSAATQLNIFNNHCDRVKMSAIAQVVNVLQAMILTEGEKMLLTPTYHVFDMFKVHQEADLVQSIVTCEDYEFEGKKIPQLNVSASVDADGRLNITITNLNPNKVADLNLDLKGFKPSAVSGKVLTADAMNKHNSFENPNALTVVDFNGFTTSDSGLTVKLPKMSVVQLELSK